MLFSHIYSSTLCNSFTVLSQVREGGSAIQLTSLISHIWVQVKTCSTGGYTVWRFLSSATKVVSCDKDYVVKTVENSRSTVCCVGILTCLKYGFPNSAESPFFQLSPNPGGVWLEESLSSAALLLRAILSSCCGERGEADVSGCSGFTAEVFSFFCRILVYWAKNKAGKTRVVGGGNGARKRGHRSANMLCYGSREHRF